MRRLAVLPLLALSLAACSGSSQADAPCQGVPTAKHTTSPLALFGALNRLDERFLCAHLGRPTAITRLPGGRERWRYDGDTFILRHGHVIAYHQSDLTSK
jgi:hypothetical protein